MLGLLSPQGVGERIAARDIPKIAILNGNHDRETSRCAAGAGPMGAADVVLALHHSLNRRGTDSELNLPGDAYVTAMLVPAGGEIHVDKHRLLNLGVRSAVFSCADGSVCLHHPTGLAAVTAKTHVLASNINTYDNQWFASQCWVHTRRVLT